ncbi:hypothetical protein TNCV_1801921 [Trichonephila clavipes]|nr:hypothetical protein TNCV_1801921 [Trichonephila clavipes]
MDSICHTQIVRFGVQGLETLWCSKIDHLESIGSSSVGRVFWAEMARLRIPSTRLVFDFPQHDAHAGKDAVWPCISLALPPPTPGCEQHLPPLQNTQLSKGTLDIVLSPPVIVLPFLGAPLYAKVGNYCTQHLCPLSNIVAKVETATFHTVPLVMPCNTQLLWSRLIQFSPISVANEKPLPPSVYYKSRSQSHHFIPETWKTTKSLRSIFPCT